LNIKVNISPGELLDKISIIELKLLKINDTAKLNNIMIEFEALNPQVVELLEKFKEPLKQKYLHLSEVNETLWDIEDAIRVKEKNKEFDSKFIELARSVYRQNDKRSIIKKFINQMTDSSLTEEKSYEEY
jgi:hypothetical protein|tara:strand:+ start:9284 stop:9673 length:390 start_codon:yes stop_codon:yes gene_type:complete